MEGADELMGNAGGPFSLSAAARYRGRRGEEECLGTATLESQVLFGTAVNIEYGHGNGYVCAFGPSLMTCSSTTLNPRTSYHASPIPG